MNFADICTKCGLCCKQAGLMKDFPEKSTKEGHCIQLSKDNTCKKYDNRPVLCRVDEGYERYFKDQFKTELEYLNHNVEVCNAMIKAAKLPEKFLVPFLKLEDYGGDGISLNQKNCELKVIYGPNEKNKKEKIFTDPEKAYNFYLSIGEAAIWDITGHRLELLEGKHYVPRDCKKDDEKDDVVPF